MKINNNTKKRYFSQSPILSADNMSDGNESNNNKSNSNGLDNEKSGSNRSSSSLPELVKSRNIDDFDTSTVPDTVTDRVENSLNKIAANNMNEVHNRAGVSYTTVESTEETIPDWSPEKLEDLGEAFDKHEYKEESQKLFDNVYENITRAYANANQLADTDCANAISIITTLHNDMHNKSSEEEHKTELDKQLQEDKASKEEIRDTIKKEALDYYNRCKEELLLAAKFSNFDLETRGHDQEYYDIQEELISEDDQYSNEAGPSSKRPRKDSSDNNSLENPSSKRFKQDSSDIVQEDFTSFDPFDE